MITKTQLGITVYDRQTNNRIDIFPPTDEGYERLSDFIIGTLKAGEVLPFFKDIELDKG